MKASDALANGVLQGSSIKEQLDNGFIYFFSGTEPATADIALDMSSTHTQLVKVAADTVPVANGIVGLQFASAAVNRALPKATAQNWSGVIAFDGAQSAQAGVSPLTATFFRFCTASDNGRGAGTSSTPRLQGTLAVAGGDANLTSTSLSANGTNTTGLANYEIRMAA
jgi:hypothetical protein